MRDYELTVLLKPEISEKELDKEIKNLQTLLEKSGAKIKSKKDAVKKMLAYEILKLREAFYGYFELEMRPEALLELDKKLRLEGNIIRYLLVSHVS